jgi:Anti-sigma regulatory factor (Ser/Thr protein kinase)
MAECGVDPDVSYELALALSEACTNAVEHSGGSSSLEYHVTAYLESDRCRIEVTDVGQGAKRFEDPAANRAVRNEQYLPSGQVEHGRGLCLIKELADHVTFHNRPGEGATISFEKMLKRQEEIAAQ